MKLRLALICILFSNSIYSAEKTKLSVVTEEWRPFNYTNKQGEIVGRSTEKVKAILDSLNYEYDVRSYPWTRAMDMAERNKNTLIYSIYRTAERENKFQWICPLMAPVKVYLFHLANRTDIKVESLDDAKNYTISVNRNDSDHEFLLEHGFVEGVNLDITSDPNAGARKLFGGRVDFVMESEWEMTETVKLNNKRNDDVKRTIEVTRVNDRQACMAFSLNTDKSIVHAVQKALDDYNAKLGLE